MAQTVLGTTLILLAVAIAGIAYYAALTPVGVGLNAFVKSMSSETEAADEDFQAASSPRVMSSSEVRVEPVTGSQFPLVHSFSVGKDMRLLGVGVRKKAILNVYSVGFYGAKQVVRSIESNSGEIARCNAAMGEKLKGSRAALLKFNMGVGAEKMAEAMANVDGPTQETKDAFMDMIVKGIGGKMKKGEEMTFEWKGANVVVVSARGEVIGEIKDKALFQGLLGIYLGEKSVSPSLKNDIDTFKAGA